MDSSSSRCVSCWPTLLSVSLFRFRLLLRHLITYSRATLFSLLTTRLVEEVKKSPLSLSLSSSLSLFRSPWKYRAKNIERDYIVQSSSWQWTVSAAAAADVSPTRHEPTLHLALWAFSTLPDGKHQRQWNNRRSSVRMRLAAKLETAQLPNCHR